MNKDSCQHKWRDGLTNSWCTKCGLADMSTEIVNTWKVQELTALETSEVVSVDNHQKNFKIYDLQNKKFLDVPCIVEVGKKYVLLIGDTANRKELNKVLKSYLTNYETQI